MIASEGKRASPSKSGVTLAESYPLSVVIPSHNTALELKLSLEALLENDITNVEILIVDDASTDSTAKVAAAVAQGQKEGAASLQYLPLKQRSGPAAARNEGLKRAKNPYVLFLDSDVVLPRQSLQWLRESLDLYSHRSDIAGVLGSYAEAIPWDDFLTNFRNLSICFLYKSTNTLSPYLHTPIFCVKKEILEEIGGFDPQFKWAEDFRLGILLGSQGFRFLIDRKIEGVHLKRYQLRTILREDWRRVGDLRAMKLEGEQKRFALRAHRFRRLLSVALPGPVLIFALLTFVGPIFGKIACSLLALFYLCNLPFLFYLRGQRGVGFALKAALFLFLEMLWAELALVGSLRIPH